MRDDRSGQYKHMQRSMSRFNVPRGGTRCALFVSGEALDETSAGPRPISPGAAGGQEVGGGCECENKLCVKLHERSTRVFQAHYHSVLVKRELTNRQWAVGRRTCRADKHLAKRRRDDGEAEERSTSLLFLRGVSDGASQGRSAFLPARRPWSRHIFGNTKKPKKSAA